MLGRRCIALCAVVTVALMPVVAGPAAAGPPGPNTSSSAIVRSWERTSIRTIYAEAATPIPVGALYLGFTSLAMYRAARAVGAHGSAEAAIAVAAHDVLREYFPASTAALDADLATSLATVTDGPAERRGILVGSRIAERLIAERTGDGRDDTSIVYTREPAPGVWQPNPGGTMLAPWLGFVRPLMLRGTFTPRGVNGPDELASATYAADLAEVQRLGSADSTLRTPAQTDTARFFNSNSAIMVTEGLLGYLDTRPMGLIDSAHLVAAMHTAMSDAIITCWRLKYDEGFWRPSQAIREANEDGNPATSSDPAWTPLLPNPPYPDYVSGHGCLTSPAVEVIRRTLGERTALTLHSYVTGTDRTFPSLRVLEDQAFQARIWSGLHFRTAMHDAYAIGHEAADRVLLRLG